MRNNWQFKLSILLARAFFANILAIF